MESCEGVATQGPAWTRSCAAGARGWRGPRAPFETSGNSSELHRKWGVRAPPVSSASAGGVSTSCARSGGRRKAWGKACLAAASETKGLRVMGGMNCEVFGVSDNLDARRRK